MCYLFRFVDFNNNTKQIDEKLYNFLSSIIVFVCSHILIINQSASHICLLIYTIAPIPRCVVWTLYLRVGQLTIVSTLTCFVSKTLLLSTSPFKTPSPSASSEAASMANCEPEMRTVHLDLPVEANTLFFPTCVRLEQCGGCCYGPLLTCRPTKTTSIFLKVRLPKFI